MAETKNKTKTKAELEEENSLLKKQLEQMDELKKQIEFLMNNKSQQTEKVVSSKKDRMITFVNMTNGMVVLKGSQIWTIDGRFNSRNFSEREAQVILNNMMNFIRQGYVYIADAEFVEENGLIDSYNYILSDEDLKTLLLKDTAYIVDTYKMVSDGQKEIIISMIVEKKMNNEYVDANILVELGKISGKDLMGIEPLDE